MMAAASLDNIKALEKVIGYIGKDMDYSAALEAAQAIIDEAKLKNVYAQDYVQINE